MLAISDEDAGDADARVEEVSQFIKATQAQLDEIERKMATFGQLKTKLGDLQSRLVPLESKDGGVADLIAQVQDIRDRLIAKIKHIEDDEDGDLAERVKTFTEAKQELEKRVATVTEQFSKLATIRNELPAYSTNCRAPRTRPRTDLRCSSAVSAHRMPSPHGRFRWPVSARGMAGGGADSRATITGARAGKVAVRRLHGKVRLKRSLYASAAYLGAGRLAFGSPIVTLLSERDICLRSRTWFANPY